MFERPSINTIYKRIKADIETRVTGLVKIPPGSLLDILARVFAGAIHLCYGTLQWISEQFFIDTATTEYLDRLGLQYGVPRKSATFATGNAFFTGTTQTIPVGTEIQNENGVVYVTTIAGELVTGEAVLPIQCVESGEIGNQELPIVYTLVDPDSLPNCDETLGTTVSPTTGGIEQEDDDSYRQRLLLHTQQPPAGGRSQDYEAWALEVPGVEKAWVFDNYIGSGSVGTVISNNDFEVLDSNIKDDVIENINNKGPLGVKKDVLDPIPETVVITAQIKPNTSTQRDSIDQNLTNLFLEVSSPSGTILLSQIRNAFANGGVTDYSITDIVFGSYGSIGVNNIVAINFELPKPSPTSFSTLP